MTKMIVRLQLFGSGLLLTAPYSTPFSVFYEFIWVFFAAINLLNLVYIRVKISSIVRTDPEMLAESKDLIKWLFVFAVFPFLLLTLFQWLGGFHHAFYVFSNNYHNPYIVLGWAVFILLDLAILYSMIWGGGARTIVRFHKAFPRMSRSETMIKVGTVLGVLGSLLSLFFMITTNTFEKFQH